MLVSERRTSRTEVALPAESVGNHQLSSRRGANLCDQLRGARRIVEDEVPRAGPRGDLPDDFECSRSDSNAVERVGEESYTRLGRRDRPQVRGFE